MDAARTTRLDNLRFSRIESSLLVSKMDAKGKGEEIVRAPHFLAHAQSHDQRCCWKVPKEGIERFAPGDRENVWSLRLELFVLFCVSPCQACVAFD